MIGVIGIGGAGGAIAHEANELGILSAAINFSSKDLKAIDVKHKLKLLGSEGVGKDRAVSSSLFAEQWETATQFVLERFANVDALVIAFASSGGSGSGLAPLLIELLCDQMPDKVISAFVIVPDLSEATVSQLNCLQVFEELNRLNVSIFPIDNQQAKNKVVGKNRIFELTNKDSIRLLHTISSYTEKHTKTTNFDKRDFLTVLGTRGIATMCEINLADCKESDAFNSEWVTNQVHSTLQEGIFIPMESNKVVRSAIIFDGQESLMQHLDYEMLFDGSMPPDTFEGYYHESNGRLYFMLTGLAWCSSRLNNIQKSLDTNEERIVSVMTPDVAYVSKSANDIMSKIRGKQEQPKKQSVTDILNKYKR